jgi:uncharacterized protein YmfQ (DUF2313 family)
MIAMAKFTRNTLEDHTQILGSLLPAGKLFDQKNFPDSILHKLITAHSKEPVRIEDKIATVAEEHDIFNTTLFIEEWESAVGIPDGCFTIAPTLEERRANIIIKIRASGVSTKEDFENIASLLGFVVTVTPMQDEIIPPIFPPFFPGRPPASRFIMIVRGVGIIPNVPPLFPPFFPSGQGQQSILQCIFELLKPANTTIIFSNIE